MAYVVFAIYWTREKKFWMAYDVFAVYRTCEKKSWSDLFLVFEVVLRLVLLVFCRVLEFQGV